VFPFERLKSVMNTPERRN